MNDDSRNSVVLVRNNLGSVLEKREKMLEFKGNSWVLNGFLEEFLFKNKDYYRFK